MLKKKQKCHYDALLCMVQWGEITLCDF